jgi:hypothetical protein
MGAGRGEVLDRQKEEWIKAGEGKRTRHAGRHAGSLRRRESCLGAIFNFSLFLLDLAIVLFVRRFSSPIVVARLWLSLVLPGCHAPKGTRLFRNPCLSLLSLIPTQVEHFVHCAGLEHVAETPLFSQSPSVTLALALDTADFDHQLEFTETCTRQGFFWPAD